MTMMTALAKALTPEEIAAAASHFSALPPRANISAAHAQATERRR
jgi:cytochrome c553